MQQQPLPEANIALVGFMGCGKTTVGQALAKRLGWEFVDTDTLIERETGQSIPALFATAGEAVFREQEERAVAEACAGKNRVIATGGGAVLREVNVTHLRERSFVVWLTVRPEVVVTRTAARAGERPVLAAGGGGDDLLTHVLRLLGERGPRYQAAAHLVVDASDRSPDALAAEISRKRDAALRKRA